MTAKEDKVQHISKKIINLSNINLGGKKETKLTTIKKGSIYFCKCILTNKFERLHLFFNISLLFILLPI